MRELDDAARALFARKGFEGGPNVPQAGDENGVKVRRVVQLAADFAGRPLAGARVLDLGCGEGVYAIEFALHGADVVAIDARHERMDEGAAVAARHGLSNVEFRIGDVRRIDRAELGEFDVVLLLGLLYHLDGPDALAVLHRIRALCAGILVVDTLVSLEPVHLLEAIGRRYEGTRVREHEDDDPPEVRRARLLRSIDNTFAYRFTKESLARALVDARFTSVLEARAPLEPGKAADRATFLARGGRPVELGAYPWVNGLSEDEIADRIGKGR